jgi:tRNA1Val (adenine37-N6)-methyltransferase
MERVTTDTFFNGSITVLQDQDGYRFSVDAVLLAHHVKPRPDDIIVDLGTGCGVIPLILGFRHPDIAFFAVEIQEDLASLAEQNVRLNKMAHRITVMRKDMKTLQQKDFPKVPHMVVCNPPYRKPDSGRLNPHSQKAVARHEIRAGLADAAAAARRILRTGGRFAAVYPAERTVDMMARLQSVRIEPKYLRVIYSKPETDAKLIIVEGIREGRPGMTIGPPLFIFQNDGTYSKEVREMFQP